MAEDGASIYIPSYKYINEKGQITTAPERVVTAQNGKGYSLTYEEIAAAERLWRQAAMTVISYNLILGASDNLDDVIRNGYKNYLGYLDNTSYIEKNYTREDALSIIPGLLEYDYTISEEALAELEDIMGPAFAAIVGDVDYTNMGIVD
jgi:hypothetical protein